MKVLLVTNMYPTIKNPYYGIFVKEQVESLTKEGVAIDVVFINGKENRLNYFISIITLAKKLKSNNYDIIHLHHTYCVYPVIIAKAIVRIKSPIILTFHEGEVHKTKELITKDIDFIKRFVFSKRIKKSALRIVDFVIAVQEELMESLEVGRKYYILPCGVDLNLFRPMSKERCRKKLNLPLDKKIIFFPAVPHDNNKGYDILREAIKYLGGKDIYLLTAGGIHHQDMPFYMCAADVVVQLSIYEASPMVLKEALAVNVPVVFTEVGDAKKTIGKTKGCFLCKRTPRDVALKLGSALKCNGKSDGRDRIVEAGLGLSDIARNVINIYENIQPLDHKKRQSQTN